MKLASLILFSLPAFGDQLMSGDAVSNGVSVNYETRLEPGSPEIRKHGGGSISGKNIIKRHLCNFDNKTYFGYDLTVETVSDGRYRFHFAPLSMTPREMTSLYDEVANWTPMPLPGGTVTTEIRAGETMALDLFVNPSTGQKITDYLTIKGKDRPQVRVDGPARDFAPEDATIAISAAHLSIDGAEVLSSQGSLAGQGVWMDIPGHGRFVFSLAPRSDLGMVKSGEVRGTKMTWRANGHEYAITTGKPITTGVRAYNLYVFHMPRTVDSFGMSAGATPEVPIRSK